MKLMELTKSYSILRYPPDHSIPSWVLKSQFYSATKTAEELSIVCSTPSGENIDGAKAEHGWRCFKVAGTLDFALTGILASIASPLADAKISIFAISTFDTDYILVKEESFLRARELLAKSGFVFD